MLSRVSNARGIWIWIQGCVPDDQHRRVFRGRNFEPPEISWDARVVAGTPTGCWRILRFIRVSTSVPGPTHARIAWHASYVRIETTNPTTSDAPSGADLLGHRPEENSNGVQFPEEKEFRLLGFTELRRSFLFASLWILNGWKFPVVRTGLFDN